jgi:hypothetical protein
MTNPHGKAIRAGIFVFAGSTGADGSISTQSITPKAIATKR